MLQVPGAVLRICLRPVGSGETLTGLSRNVFRSLTGSGIGGRGMGVGVEGRTAGRVSEVMRIKMMEVSIRALGMD